MTEVARPNLIGGDPAVRQYTVSSSLSRITFNAGCGSRATSFVATHAGGARDLLQGIWESEFDLASSAVPGGFTRQGIFSPDLLVILLLYMAASGGQHGYQTLLDLFWDDAAKSGFELPCDKPPTAPSLCNARKKLRPSAVRSMLRSVARAVIERQAPRWRGLRVLAVDGSRLCVQRSKRLWQECGGPTGGGTPQVQITTLFELFSELPLDVDVGPYRASEREQLLSHLECLDRGDLIVLDRGYPGFGLLKTLRERGIHFVVRVPTSSTFPAVERFLASRRCDREIVVDPSRDYVCAHPGVEHEPLRLRAVRLKTPGGSVAILTSLPRKRATRKHIGELYRLRWRVEEYYKLIKSDHFGQRQFHAKYLAGVRQEIYAQALLVVLMRSLAASATHPQAELGARSTIHVKSTIALVARHLLDLMWSDDDQLNVLVQRVHEHVRRRYRPPRPSRSCPRRSYKPYPRWHAHGRRGKSLR